MHELNIAFEYVELSSFWNDTAVVMPTGGCIETDDWEENDMFTHYPKRTTMPSIPPLTVDLDI